MVWHSCSRYYYQINIYRNPPGQMKPIHKLKATWRQADDVRMNIFPGKEGPFFCGDKGALSTKLLRKHTYERQQRMPFL